MQTKEHGCLSMSDSTRAMLGLTAAQFAQVRESDARYLTARELMVDGMQRAMNEEALAAHDADMRRIMTADQHAKWRALCNTSKAERGNSKAPKA